MAPQPCAKTCSSEEDESTSVWSVRTCARMAATSGAHVTPTTTLAPSSPLVAAPVTMAALTSSARANRSSERKGNTLWLDGRASAMKKTMVAVAAASIATERRTRRGSSEHTKAHNTAIHWLTTVYRRNILAARLDRSTVVTSVSSNKASRSVAVLFGVVSRETPKVNRSVTRGGDCFRPWSKEGSDTDTSERATAPTLPSKLLQNTTAK
mmetsp:Transcript_63940/g.139118  ORF Transcript_63940/g.139118 Transcript_63940/m.139118 type:complete len:210 (+) Transcript_63940:198-827(+)